MRTWACSFLAVALAAVPAAAQTKISGKPTCAKPDPSYSIPVYDQADHGLMLHKEACTWDTPLVIAELRSKSAENVAVGEMRGASLTDTGHNTSTMDNADTFTVHYTGHVTAAKDGTATFKGTWRFVAGTGKLDGIRGHETCSGSGNADGSGVVNIEGEYTLAAARTKPEAAAN